MAYDQPLLRCPACGADAVPGRACRCGLDVNRDGIMDFVQGAASTALDNIDYDAHYSTSFERANLQFASLKACLGARLPSQIGQVLEIGCGTGGFTTGFLGGVNINTAVLSDISPKMLAICRRRLADAGLLDRQQTFFATYSGQERCFAPDSFDLVYGYFVVHHILDVEAFLRDMASVLKPGGIAIFVEPNLKFHEALVATMGEVAAELIARKRDDLSISHILNWITEVRYNLLNNGDLERLKAREDKHMFSADQIERLGRSAGFTEIEVIPHGAAEAAKGMSEYLSQVPIRPEVYKEALELAGAYGPRHLARVSPQDGAAASVFYLRKGQPAPNRADLRLSWADGVLSLQGWVCSPVTIRKLIITVDDARHFGSVWLPRRDVFEVWGSAYPTLNALGSGVSEQIPCPKPSAVSVVAEHVDGSTTPITVTPG